METALEQKFHKQNIFTTHPLGILITDTFNNPWYPLERVSIDTEKLQLPQLHKEFRAKYASSPTNKFLPWHFTIEFAGELYMPLVTRPINYKSLIPKFENYLIICIVGDSNIDVYDDTLYRTITDYIINPLLLIRSWRTPLNENNLKIKMGSKWDTAKLYSYLKV